MKRILPLLATYLFASCTHAQTNFIFVTIDDLSRESLGIHGCTIPGISPNLDSLAQSGLRFEHCHVQSANCTPSRNIMSSGLYQQRNRVFSLGSEGAGNHHTLPALPDVFRTAGYHTGLMGKNGHMSPFEPYSGFDVIYDSYGSTRDPENIYSKLSSAFSDAAAAGKPLYFNLNIFDPHTGWYKWDHAAGDFKVTTEVDPSIIYDETDIPYPTWFPPLSEAEQIDPSTGNSMKDELAAYYNTVKRADDSIARMLDAIEDAGQTENTILVVVADHGMQEPAVKTQLYDHSTRSPLFVVWPGVTSSNTVNDTHMIASFDLLPTFAEMISQPIPAGMDGRSFAPIIKGESIPEWRDYIYKQQNDRNKMRAIQTPELLYIYNPWSDGSTQVGTVDTGMLCWRRIKAAGDSGTNAAAHAYAEFFLYRTVEELYDITNDPDCLTNLFSSAAYSNEVAMMQDLMLQEMIASDDHLVLNAFTNWLNTANPAFNAQFVADQTAFQNTQADDPNYARDVFYDPHDDWHELGKTLFEPSGEWDIWTPESGSISINGGAGDADSGPSCIEFNGSAADLSRLIVSNPIDTSAFTQLKLDAIFIDAAAFSGGATVSFQYNDGSGWQTFQTITGAGKKNLTFELPGGGLPESMQFGILADMNGTGGSIYMDHARLTAWQDWAAKLTDTPFDASNMATVRLAFNFECQNFSDTDRLLLEYYDGANWELLEGYDFSYVLLADKLYTDTIDMSADDYSFPTNLQFRFRSESTGSGQAFTVSDYTIETRSASDDTPKAFDDSYSATAPVGIVVSAPGVLDNDSSGSGGVLTASVLTNVSHGILEFNSDGSFVYAITNGHTGTDSFNYVAVNSSLLSSTATVSLAINEPVSDPIIFFDDFESGTVTTGGWEYADEAKSTYYMGGAAYNGEFGANQRKGGSITKTVSTVGYTDIKVQYWRKGNTLTDPGDALVVAWSTNGISWIELENTTDENWAYTSNSLPASAADQPELSVRLGVNSTLWAHKAYFDDVLIQGTPTASGSALTNFSDWATTHGVATNNAYLLDYAFNINPHLSERYPLAADGSSGLTVWELSKTEEKLIVEFVRRKQASDLTYKAQFTDSLMTNWTDAVLGETITPINDEFERVSVSDSITTATATNRFGRVIVIKN